VTPLPGGFYDTPLPFHVVPDDSDEEDGNEAGPVDDADFAISDDEVRSHFAALIGY